MTGNRLKPHCDCCLHGHKKIRLHRIPNQQSSIYGQSGTIQYQHMPSTIWRQTKTSNTCSNLKTPREYIWQTEWNSISSSLMNKMTPLLEDFEANQRYTIQPQCQRARASGWGSSVPHVERAGISAFLSCMPHCHRWSEGHHPVLSGTLSNFRLRVTPCLLVQKVFRFPVIWIVLYTCIEH